MSVQDVTPPESPRIRHARVAHDVGTGGECLLVEDEHGRELAFVFEVESDAPGLSLVDPARWRQAAASMEDSPERFEVVVEPRADEWLPSLVAHPVAAEWLRRIEERHPAAYGIWFGQTQYESGGEQGSG